MRTLVFDFDKTLTYKDSLTELFRQNMTGLKVVFKPLYLGLKVLSKLSIISVRYEKEMMLRMLFGGSSKRLTEAIGQLRVELSPLIKELRRFAEEGERVIVISASLEEYLCEVIADERVVIIGTRLMLSSDGKWFDGIVQHPFAGEKKRLLEVYGVKKIDEMWYDSKSDECLVAMCTIWNKVKGGKIINTYTI